MGWRLLIAYVTPLILLAVVFHLQYGATLREGIDNHLKSIAENQRNTVDLYLRERVANLRSAFRAGASTAVPGALDLKQLLYDLRLESPAFVDVGLFAPDGTLTAYAGPYQSLMGRTYSEENWWKELAHQHHDHIISDVYLGFRRQPHFVVAVRREVGKRFWVLRASVDPKRFAEFVRSSYLVRAAEALIVNHRGSRQTITTSVAKKHLKIPVPERSRTAVVRTLEEEGRSYLTAFAWLSETNWVLVVRVPTSAAYAPIRRARLVLAGILLVTLVLIVVVVLRSSRRLVGQLEAADQARADLRGQLFRAAKLVSIGEMAAGVAHEINNPLAIIYEEAGMLLDQLDPQFAQRVDSEELRERLNAVLEATMRGKVITRKLLAFARQTESGVEPSDLNRLVNRVLEVKARELEVSNIAVATSLAEDLPLVLVNRNQIDQVLLNLLNNAQDAIQGGGRIDVRTSVANGLVRVEVGDTGCGMTEEHMENAFFPFFTTKDVGKGTGLGLSISYGIVKSMGGAIEVESEPGVGSVFTVLFPALPPQKHSPAGLQIEEDA